MNKIEVLEKTRELISKPENWTQGTFARSNGIPSGIYDEDTDQWCLLGAISKAIYEINITDPDFDIEVCSEIRETAGIRGSLVAFNDDALDHAEIINALDNTIDRLKDQ